MARIPLSLVTGFLGSGKTTFLRHTARRLASRRVVYLVNEFSALDVDGLVLREIGPNVVSIPGGSIFCKCLVVNFLYHLTEIPRIYQTPDEPLEGVIVEASGIANPKVVADMLRETKLDEVYELASIVTVTDPGSLRKLLVTLPNIRAQIEAADVVLLNKIDLFGRQDIAAVEAAIVDINHKVRLIPTQHAAADIELFGESRLRPDLHGQYAECADPHYGRFSAAFHQPVDLERLRAGLADLGEDLYRAKGFVPTADGMVYLDISTAGLILEPSERADVQSGLAMIGRAERAQRLEAFVDQIAVGHFAAGRADRP